MPKLTVNGVEVEVENGATVLHACEEAVVEVLRAAGLARLAADEAAHDAALAEGVDYQRHE